ncbi:Pimeloyl-ACP methyl ester carboxylesterase [Luteibacter sp. UNCMF331Sha3.1]|uniref:alpha/beta fold hydrolase n=1 Tax=Luteibacter sp. UNCMF331Sha3.1 TaxID=1502760 RepID=UPI0008CB7C2F|nr:alpha/beta hydrolase [Luteibacter sp. UNCMF331Sha3.1]SEN11336.1 Pimeloyl-ACP methyl ester carboxylesterase [Luteibacter sp. UNCMF331Sha3.1]
MNHASTHPELPQGRELRVPGPGGTLSVRHFDGAGPAFVMMHGFPDNQHIYDHLIPHLVGAGRQVVTFDFLGFGESDKPAGATYSFRQQVEDLAAVVDHLSLRRVIPVAHDSSGPAALNFALDYPDRVDGMVLLNCLYAESATMRHPEFIEFFASPALRALTDAVVRSPAQFAWILQFQRARFQEVLADEHRERYHAFLGPLIDANFREQPSSGPAFAQMTGQLLAEEASNSARLPELASIKVPVRLVWGVNDPYLNTGVAEDMLRHLPTGTYHPVQAGHWLQIDVPVETAAAMLS